jgi:hypothetical protein
MPVGSDHSAAQKKTAIAKGLEAVGIEARFPDYLPLQPKFALTDLLTEMRGAELVIADLSRERPSCYYELGLAEAIGKRVYLIAEQGTQIHQTASRSTVHYYSNLAELASVVERVLANVDH